MASSEGYRLLQAGRGLAWALALLTALGGLAISLAWFDLGDLAVESDFFAELAPAAQRLAAGEIDVANHPYKGPFQPLLLAAVHALLGPFGVGWYRCGVLISLLSAAGTLLLVHDLTRRLAGRWVALVTVCLVAVTSEFFVNGHKAATDQLFTLLMVLAAWLLLTRPAGRRTWLATGLVGGLAFLTRYIGIVVPVWALVTVLLLDPDRRPWRGRLAAAAWIAGAALLVVAPWLVLNLVQAGTPLATRNAENLARAVLGEGASVGALAEAMSERPWRVLGRLALNVPAHLRADGRHLLGPVFGTLALIGGAVLVRRRPDRRLAAVLMGAGIYALGLAAVFHVPRFSLPLLPAYALLAALGLAALPRGRAVAATVAVLLIGAMHADFTARQIRFYRAEQPVSLAASIAWLREAAPPGSGLMARKPHAAFFAGLVHVPLPRVLPGAGPLLAVGAERGADFVLVGPLERRFHPDAAWLARLPEYAGVGVGHRDSAATVFVLDPHAAGFATRAPIERARARWREVASTGAATDTLLAVSETLTTLLGGDGDLAGARDVLIETVAAVPDADSFGPRLALAWYCWKLGDGPTGAAALAGHLAAAPEPFLRAQAHDLLGRNLLAAGRHDEGRAELAQARALYLRLGRDSSVAEIDEALAR